MYATSGDSSEEQVHTYPVSDEETRIRGREGPRTSAGAAFSARDISVGEVVPPPTWLYKVFHSNSSNCFFQPT